MRISVTPQKPERGGRPRRSPVQALQTAYLRRLGVPYRTLTTILRRYRHQLPPVADKSDTVWFNTAARYVRDGEQVDAWFVGFARRLKAVARASMIGQLTTREQALIHEQYVRPAFGALLEILAWSIDEFRAGRILLRDHRGQVAPVRAATAHWRRLLLAQEVSRRAAEVAEVVALASAKVAGKRVPAPSPSWDDDLPAIG